MIDQKGLVPVLIVIILAVLMVGGYLVYQNEIRSDPYPPLNYQWAQLSNPKPKLSPSPFDVTHESTTSGETANWKTYTHDELGITFSYPSEWGDIKEEKDNDCWPGAPQPCVHIFLTPSKISKDSVLLGSGNNSYIYNVVGKGAYFGHRIGKAYRYGTPFEKFVKEYCTSNREESKHCETKINQNGILYTKSLETNYDTLEGLALYYYVYHPNHQFQGMTLSNEGFLNTPFEKNSEKALDQILSTFKSLP